MNSTPSAFVAVATALKSGASTRQGGHHGPQKLSTTTLPCWACRSQLPPPTSAPVTSGADFRSVAAMVWPVGVPLTNRNSPPAAWSTASDPVVQPTSVASDAVSSSTSRREYRRTGRVSPPNLELTHPGLVSGGSVTGRLGVGHPQHRVPGEREAWSATPARTAAGAGSCQSRLRSTSRRSVQIGSWWLTQTASCPSAASRARHAAANIRAAICAYGSPQDGRERVAQHPPVPRVAQTRRRRGRTACPRTSSRLDQPLVQLRPAGPSAAAIGSAVSCARSSGEATT